MHSMVTKRDWQQRYSYQETSWAVVCDWSTHCFVRSCHHALLRHLCGLYAVEGVAHPGRYSRDVRIVDRHAASPVQEYRPIGHLASGLNFSACAHSLQPAQWVTKGCVPHLPSGCRYQKLRSHAGFTSAVCVAAHAHER